MKRIGLLLGSPRMGGNSEILADAFAQGAEKRGYESRKLRLATLSLKGCADCGQCWAHEKPCVIEDDISTVYDILENSEILCFVTPLYFYSWPSQVKPVWDRLLPYVADGAPKSLEGKKIVLIATAGDENPSCFDGLRTSFHIVSTYMKWEILGELYAHRVYAKGDVYKTHWVEDAERLGERLP